MRDDTIRPFVSRLRAALGKLHARTQLLVRKCFNDDTDTALAFHGSPAFARPPHEFTCRHSREYDVTVKRCADGSLAYSPLNNATGNARFEHRGYKKKRDINAEMDAQQKSMKGIRFAMRTMEEDMKGRARDFSNLLARMRWLTNKTQALEERLARLEAGASAPY